MRSSRFLSVCACLVYVVLAKMTTESADAANNTGRCWWPQPPLPKFLRPAPAPEPEPGPRAQAERPGGGKRPEDISSALAAFTWLAVVSSMLVFSQPTPPPSRLRETSLDTLDQVKENMSSLFGSSATATSEYAADSSTERTLVASLKVGMSDKATANGAADADLQPPSSRRSSSSSRSRRSLLSPAPSSSSTRSPRT